MSKIWLVTGSASGLGRSVAEAILASGDRLMATARDPRRLEDLAKNHGDRVRADTNFYGVVNVTRAALPVMRKQRSGCILQISSVGGRLALPGSAGYHAAKWAVGGFTEALAQEAAPFGVRVCALERGGMRTKWGARANKETPALLPDYDASVGAVADALKSVWGQETSDPTREAQVILRLAVADRLPAHLLLGSDAVQFAERAEAARAAEAARWRDISVWTDFDGPGPFPPPAPASVDE